MAIIQWWADLPPPGTRLESKRAGSNRVKVFKAIKTFKAIVAITASSAIIAFTFKPISYRISPVLQACFVYKQHNFS